MTIRHGISKCFALILLLSLSAHCASSAKLIFKGEVETDNGSMADARVAIYENGNFKEFKFSDRRGRFHVEMKPGTQYVITTTRSGYLSQMVRVTTPEIFDDRRIRFTFHLLDRNDEVISDDDVATLSADIKYDPAKGKFDYDKESCCRVITAQRSKYAVREEEDSKSVLKRKL